MTDPSPTTAASGRQSGIGLIELVITLAIVGIMTSIAVPSYGKYVTKTKVAEAVHLNHRVRVAMEQYHMKYGKFVVSTGGLEVRNASVGLNDPSSYETDIILKMWVGNAGVVGKDDTSGHIAITFNTDLGLNNKTWARLISTIEYENGTYNFICGNSDAKYSTNIDHEYLPASCRN